MRIFVIDVRHVIVCLPIAIVPLMTVTLRTAATGRRSNSQAVRAHDCTRRVYATYACAAHNVKLLGEDANFDAKADLVFIRDVKSGDEAG